MMSSTGSKAAFIPLPPPEQWVNCRRVKTSIQVVEDGHYLRVLLLIEKSVLLKPAFRPFVTPHFFCMTTLLSRFDARDFEWSPASTCSTWGSRRPCLFSCPIPLSHFVLCYWSQWFDVMVQSLTACSFKHLDSSVPKWKWHLFFLLISPLLMRTPNAVSSFFAQRTEKVIKSAAKPFPHSHIHLILCDARGPDRHVCLCGISIRVGALYLCNFDRFCD